MRILQGALGLLFLGLTVSEASAQFIEQTQHLFRRPGLQTPACEMPDLTAPVDPNNPDMKPPIPGVAPDVFQQAPSAGSSAGQTFNPAMFGDLGASGISTITIPGSTTTTTRTVIIPSPPGSQFPPTITRVTTTTTIPARMLELPVIGHTGYKISDNESPSPTDRFFLTYNYYNDVHTVDTSFNLDRELIGFEKTFLNGDASIGVRLPFIQTPSSTGFTGIDNNEIGDLTVILKYAFINDRTTGNVLSGGLAITVPTSQGIETGYTNNYIRDVLFQPYAGWVVNRGDLFVQGFHSVVVPSDHRDLTSISNDVGVGYWMYRNPQTFVRGIVPMLEGHLFTPLDHRGSDDLIQGFDIFTFTVGVNFVLPGGSTLGAAFALPTTGPRLNRAEAIVAFNYRF